MTDTSSGPDDYSTSTKRRRAGVDYARLWLVLICIAVGFIGGYIGDQFTEKVSWAEAGGYVVLLVTACIAAMAFFRFADALLIRRSVIRQVDGSRKYSRATLEFLDSLSPETEPQSESEVEALVDEALQFERHRRNPAQ